MVTEPVAREPAGMEMEAEPAERAVAAEVYAPLERTTEPEGIIPEPVMVMVTARACAVVMEDEAGLTVTAGVVGFWPPPEELPPPPQEARERVAARRAVREK